VRICAGIYIYINNNNYHIININICCEEQRERAAQPSKEPQRGVNSLDGKVKRNHLNTPRYEYSDVYTHGDKTRSTQMDPSEWRCVCVENKEGYNGL